MTKKMLTISAQLWKLEKDWEGEITLIFKIPSKDMPKAIQIPIMTELKLKVEDKKEETVL
jgi:hypothetical protein